MTRRTLPTAVHALRRNYLRAALTTLGIVIGIAAVIAMMEIGQGSASAIEKMLSSMGANNLLVLPGTAASSGVSFGAGTAMTLTAEDCAAILRECPAVRSATPIIRARSQIVVGSANWVPNHMVGADPAFFDVRDWRSLAQGTFFEDRDVRNANKVCLIGMTLVRELFRGESPLGKDIRVQNVPFRVIGVLSPKGSNMMGMDQDDILVAPWTTMKYRVSGLGGAVVSNGSTSSASAAVQTGLYPRTQINLYPGDGQGSTAGTPSPFRWSNIDQILVSARSPAEIPSAIDQIAEVLRGRHRIHPGEADDFSIRDMTEMTKTLASTSSMLTRLLLVVALISLVVGGVGIMNIMLVSVTERTREIGLRMAVGARPLDILSQFIVEALVLCLAGGVLGILLGRGCSLLVRFGLGWPTEISFWAISAAVIVSGSVGIIFGYYPAWKASKLDPIEALRYE